MNELQEARISVAGTMRQTHGLTPENCDTPNKSQSGDIGSVSCLVLLRETE